MDRRQQVAYHETARTKPQEFFEAIELELTRQLDADFAFTHTLTKNPLHDRWIVETFPAKYHLSPVYTKCRTPSDEEIEDFGFFQKRYST